MTRSLSRYVPRLAAEWELDAPDRTWQAFDASLCMVDISGFTRLSERLARRGRIGAEELTEVLNRMFGSMLDLAYARGGGLLKFGGDALLLVFRGDGHGVQAASAAVEMRAALRQAASLPTSVGRVPLQMSVGVHSGEVHAFLVGGSHRELVIAGPAASTTTAMEHVAGPGEIVVSAATRALLPAGAADAPAGAGWKLRWRQPGAAPIGPAAPRSVAPEALDTLVPLGLRAHLSGGEIEQEHRAATVGFIRFSGVDALMADGGPEPVAATLDGVIRAAQEAVDAEELTFLATDIDRDGGKVIVAAGVPAAREDGEGRMLRAVRRLVDADAGLPLQIGVNSGHVFAGEVGMRYRATYTVMGDTVNVAARLMASAPRGAVYCSLPVIERSRSLFTTATLPPLEVKGKAAALHAVQLGVETGTRAASGGANELPFTGRWAERAVVAAALAALHRDGTGGAVVVDGDTGVGKSRLVAEALADHEGIVIGTVRGEPYGTNFPYRALRDAVRELLGIPRADQATMAALLTRRVAELDPALTPMQPLIGEVAHITVEATPEVDAIEPRFRRDRLADVVIDLVARQVPGPVVLAVEDAHWVDEATAHLLDRVVEASRTEHPWLLVVVRRPVPGGFAPEPATTVHLEPLDSAEAEELVHASTEATPLRPHDVTTIVARSAGNPLFLQEILRLVQLTGSTASLPDSLEAVIGSDIDALPPTARQILRCASVLGRSFRPETLDLLLDGEHLGMEPAARAALERFIEIDADRWRFRHALVRDTAYEGLSYRRRRELHRRAGAATERLAGADVEQVAGILARHYSAAQDYDMAWRFARVAAVRAKAAYTNVEAAMYYEQALDALRRLPDVPDRDRAEMWQGLGDVREQLGLFDEALDAYRKASRLTRDDPHAGTELVLRRARVRERAGAYASALRELTAGSRRLDGMEPLEALRWRARLTALQAIVRQGQQRPVDALEQARRAIDEAERSGERHALGQAYGVRAWASLVLGLPDRTGSAAAALAIFEELGDLPAQATYTNSLGAEAYFEGRWDDALAYYQRAKDTFLRSGNPTSAAYGSMNSGEILVNQGRLDEAEPLLREAQRVLRASRAEDAQFAEIQLGRLLMDRGDLEGAERCLTHAQLDAAAIGLHDSALEAAVHLADCHLRRGDPSLALDTLRSAQRAARAEASLYETLVANVEAQILSALDLPDEARAAATVGIESAREQGQVYELALLLRTAAGIEVASGGEPDPIAVAEATAILEQLGCGSLIAASAPSAGRRLRSTPR